MTARRTKKRDYHHGDLKNALLQAAIATLETHGWHQLSLRDVARQAGVSHTAPYRHFASKEALLAAVSAEGFNELADAMEDAVRAAPGDFVEQLKGTGRAYVALALRRPALFRLMFSGAVCTFPPDSTFSQVARRSFDLLVRIIAQGQAAGVLRGGPSEEAALAAWSMVHGLGMLLLEQQLSVLQAEAGAPMALVDTVVGRLHHGLVPAGEPVPPSPRGRRTR